MQYTNNFQLTLWDASDHVLRESFNSNNEKIDAALGGMPKVAFGTYTGTGKYGTSNPTQLTLPFSPAFLLVTNSVNTIRLQCFQGTEKSYTYLAMDSALMQLTWNGQNVSWCGVNSDGGAVYQLNASGEVYRYFAAA